jgi:hypothetical protein
MGRNTQLAHQHQVQAHAERRGHFIGHRHAAPGQGQDNYIGAMGIGEQRLYQASTGVDAVPQKGLRRLIHLKTSPGDQRLSVRITSSIVGSTVTGSKLEHEDNAQPQFLVGASLLAKTA